MNNSSCFSINNCCSQFCIMLMIIISKVWRFKLNKKYHFCVYYVIIGGLQYRLTILINKIGRFPL